MPARDGTGPMGRGAMTGRGFGFCNASESVGYGQGFGFGRGLGLGCRRGLGQQGLGLGFRRSFTSEADTSKTHKEVLTEKKEFLENRLDLINKQIENL